MSPHPRNIKLLFALILLLLVYIARQKRFEQQYFDRYLEHPRGGDSTKSKFQTEVDKWVKCMEKDLYVDRESWYYVRFATERCKNASIFLNVPIMKLETNVEYQTGIRSYDMFIATKKEPFVFVTIGNYTDSRTRKNMTDELPTDLKTYGTHLNSSNIYWDYGSLANYLNQSESAGIGHFSTYLKTQVNHKVIDLISIKEEVNNYKIFHEISRMGKLDENGQIVCQIEIRLAPPTSQTIKHLMAGLSLIFNDSRYVLLSFHNLELFLVNYEHQECRGKYLAPYI